MPVWLQYLAAFGGGSGLLALVGSAIGFGRLLGAVDAIKEKVAAIPQMAEDIAFLKGVNDGKKAAAVEALTEHIAPEPRRAKRIAAF